MTGADGGEADERDGDAGRTYSRRDALKLAGAGALGASGLRVGYEVTGYGVVSGTNITEQRLAPLARRHLHAYPFDLALGGRDLSFDGETLTLRADGDALASLRVGETTPSAAAATGDDYGVGGPFREVVADAGAVREGDVAFEFSGVEAFFERLRGADVRPYTVAALRGGWYREPGAALVRRFAGVDPADPEALVSGLAEGFREHAYFDVARYALANVQDHVLFGALPLRSYVADDTGFEGMLEGTRGLYCWEYALRSIEAFHAVAPHRQSAPVFGAIVFDERHNHVYTGLASAVRDGGLRIPMTFLDYSHSTMYDTYLLRWLLGDGVDAYGGEHRVSRIDYWNVYGR